MKKIILPLVLLVGTLAFWGASYVLPQLLKEESIKTGAGVYALVGAMLGVFLRQFMAVSGTDVLRPREAQRYMSARQTIRRKMWAVVAASTIASACLWALATLSDQLTWNAWLRLLVGACLALGVYFLIAIASWLSDLAQFSDNLRLKEQTRKYSDAVLKRLADAAKHSAPQR